MPKARRVYRNRPEELCCLHLEKIGFTPSKKGWPDFIGVHDDGRVMAVEVKAYDRHPLKRDQLTVMRILYKAGIACFRFSPDKGLVPFNFQDEIERQKASYIMRQGPKLHREQIRTAKKIVRRQQRDTVDIVTKYEGREIDIIDPPLWRQGIAGSSS